METTIATTVSTDGRDNVVPVVVVDGMTVIVRPGGFTLDGINYTAEEERFTITPSPFAQIVELYYVWDKALNTVDLLADEVFADGFDTPYDFPEDGPFKYLFRIAQIDVSANPTDLAQAKMLVFRILPKERRE